MVTSALSHTDDQGLAEYFGSMPAAYRLAFSYPECVEHCEIVMRRQDRAVHVERWRTLANKTSIICVVANDEPRLLSLICRVLVDQRFEVASAQIYSRECDDGQREAVDFFWVRGYGSARLRSVNPREVSEAERKLGQELTLSSSAGGTSTSVPPRTALDPIPTARAFFADTVQSDNSRLITVECKDHPGLLLTLTEALHDEQVEIVSSEVTTQGWLARDMFWVRELSGQPLSGTRVELVRHSVLDAVRRARFRLEANESAAQK